MSARTTVSLIGLILAALYVNFAPYLGAVQAEHLWYCDTEFEFGIERDECVFYERPLRHLPTSLFVRPTQAFDKWYTLGEKMIERFGTPGSEPTDFFGTIQKRLFWIGLYNTGIVFIALFVTISYILAVTSAPTDSTLPDPLDDSQ